MSTRRKGHRRWKRGWPQRESQGDAFRDRKRKLAQEPMVEAQLAYNKAKGLN